MRKKASFNHLFLIKKIRLAPLFQESFDSNSPSGQICKLTVNKRRSRVIPTLWRTKVLGNPARHPNTIKVEIYRSTPVIAHKNQLFFQNLFEEGKPQTKPFIFSSVVSATFPRTTTSFGTQFSGWVERRK